MEKTIIEKLFTTSDSVFLVLLVGLALGMWWLIRWILKTNNERESRYIDTIDRLAQVDGLRSDIAELRKDVTEGNKRQESMIGRILDKLPSGKEG